MNYVIQIVFFLIAIVSSFIIWKKDRKDSKKGQKNRLKILFGLAVGGSLLALFYGIQNEIEQNKNDELLHRIDTLQNSVLDNITGGDSFCQLSLYYGNLPEGENRHMQYVSFGLIGKFPLQNVSVRVVNLNSPNPERREEFEFKIDRVQPQIFVPTNRMIEMDTIKGVNLNIFYEANNGLSTQLFRMRFRNGLWSKAERFHHGLFANGKHLDLIDENYPFKNTIDIFVLDKK